MVDFLQMVLSGIAVGSSYALMGLGMVLIYKASEVPNFVQGEMALLPVFIAYMLLSSYGLPYYIAFPATLIFAFILGCVLEFAVLRRAKEPNVLGLIIITIGLEMLLIGFVSWKFGADQHVMPFPISTYDSYHHWRYFYQYPGYADPGGGPDHHADPVSLFQVLQNRRGHESHPAERKRRRLDGYQDQSDPHDHLGHIGCGGQRGRSFDCASPDATLHDVGPHAQGIRRCRGGGHDLPARSGLSAPTSWVWWNTCSVAMYPSNSNPL